MRRVSNCRESYHRSRRKKRQVGQAGKWRNLESSPTKQDRTLAFRRCRYASLGGGMEKSEYWIAECRPGNARGRAGTLFKRESRARVP